jgi:hypothetical protein
MLSALPLIDAQTDGSVATEVPTFLMINVAPNPIGSGQQALVNAFMTKPPLTAGFMGPGTMVDGIKVEVTAPDGTKRTLDMGKSDSTGGTWTNFTPGQVGNYTFKATYPGQHAEETVMNFFGPPTFYNITYQPSVSDTVPLQFKRNLYRCSTLPRFQPSTGRDQFRHRTISGLHLAPTGTDWQHRLLQPQAATMLLQFPAIRNSAKHRTHNVG